MISEDANMSGAAMSNQVDDVKQTVREKAHEASEAVREFGEHARDIASEKLHELRDRAEEYYEEGRRRTVDAEHWLEECVKNRPLESIAIAAVVGMVAGYFLHRR